MPVWFCRRSEAGLIRSSPRKRGPSAWQKGLDARLRGNERDVRMPACAGTTAEQRRARMNINSKTGAWQPPEAIARDEIVARSAAILGKPDLALRQTEDIFRISALGLEWDL